MNILEIIGCVIFWILTVFGLVLFIYWVFWYEDPHTFHCKKCSFYTDNKWDSFVIRNDEGGICPGCGERKEMWEWKVGEVKKGRTREEIELSEAARIKHHIGRSIVEDRIRRGHYNP